MAFLMGTQIVLPGQGYSVSRRWARYKVELPVLMSFQKHGKLAMVEGQGSELSCGGMAVFLPIDLEIGDMIALEFMPPYSKRRVAMIGIVRNRRIYSYGVEFSTFKKAA